MTGERPQPTHFTDNPQRLRKVGRPASSAWCQCQSRSKASQVGLRGPPGGRAREGSALPSNNTGARCSGARVGIPCRSQEDTEEGTKERAGALGGNQGCQGDGRP